MVLGGFGVSKQGGFTSVLEERNNTTKAGTFISGTRGDVSGIRRYSGSPVHTSPKSTAFLNNHNFRYNRPSYFLDLNPIDHVWVELKRWLYQQYPDIPVDH